MKWKIVPLNTDIKVEAPDAVEALIAFATNMDSDMSQYFKAVPENVTTVTQMKKLKQGDVFVLPNNETHTASTDAAYNGDCDCWIVYDEYGNSWFDSDFAIC